jgi:hypothetical protein
VADFAALLAARLPAVYTRLGQPAVHTSAADGYATDLQVLFDTGGGIAGLDLMMQGDSPTVRLSAASLPTGVLRGDAFTINDVGYVARENGVPLLDGAEWLVPLGKA